MLAEIAQVDQTQSAFILLVPLCSGTFVDAALTCPDLETGFEALEPNSLVYACTQVETDSAIAVSGCLVLR